MDKINARVFCKAAECGSFVQTAQELGYTQAGVSYIINSMERELGFSLFIRERGGVRLSPEGEELRPILQAMEYDMRRFTEKINDIRGLQCGTVRVLVFDSVSIHWLPGILKEYTTRYPGIHVELVTVESTRDAEDMVRSQEVDCGFFLHKPGEDLDMAPLMEENMLAIVSPEHPLAALDRFPMAELGHYPYISMAYADENGIADIFRARNVEPMVAYQLDNDYAAMAMVSAGLGFCIFPELLLQDAPYALKMMEFDEPVCRTVSIVTKSRKTCSSAAKEFISTTERWVRAHRK